MRKGLFVGINHFKIPGNDLRGCVPDALEMSSMFALDSKSVLTDQQAVKARVLQSLTGLCQEAKDGNLSYLAVSWSGHGTHYPRPEEPDGLGEALVCYDIAEQGDDWNPATIIKDQELKEALNAFPASCLVEVWLDTCYSGGMDRALLQADEPHPKFMHNPGNAQRAIRLSSSGYSQGLNANIVMWQACSEAQVSADAPIPENGWHGAFTWGFGLA